MKYILLSLLTGLILPIQLSAQWTQTNGPYGGISCMVSSPEGILYAGTHDAGVYQSSDDGETWESLNRGLTTMSVNSLAMDSAGNLYASIIRKGVFKYSKENNSWTQIINGLKNWSVSEILVNSKGYLFAVTTLSTGDGMEGEGDDGGGGEVYRSIDGGETWEIKTYLGGNIIETSNIACNSKDELYVASSGGLIISLDDGETWSSSFGEMFNALFIDNGDRVFVVNPFEGLYRSDDSGATWDKLPVYVLCLSENNNNELYAATSGSGVITSNDNGDTWTPIHNNQIPLFVNHVSTHEDNYLFTSSYNGLYRTSNDGINWEVKNNGIVSSRINLLETNESGHVFAASSDISSLNDEIFRSTDQGISWENISESLPSILINSISTGNNGLIMVTGHDYNTGKLFRSNDNGETWTELLNDYTYFHPVGVIQNSANELFVATDGDGVLKSSDNGETWTNESFGLDCSNLSSIILDNEGNILVGTTCYETGIYKSTDNGATWNPSNFQFEESSIQILKNNGEGVLFASGNYIYRSLNNGLTWENISHSGSFYVYTNDIKTGINGKVLISTSSGIFESNNNGDTWSEINEGLISNDSRSVAITLDGTIYSSIWGNGVWRSNSLTTDVPELASSKGFRIYPNPARGNITISYPTQGNPVASIYNAKGTLVKFIQLNNHSTRINLDNLSKGMYIITLTGHDKAQKLVIQ